MRCVAVLTLCGVLGVTSGCVSGGPPVSGVVYATVVYPSQYAGAASQGPGTRRGTSQLSSILGLVSFGDASVETACGKAGITQLRTVDHHYTNVLYLYSTWTTIVTGE